MKECSRNSGQLFKYNSDTTQLLFYANESMCVTREAQANCSISPYSTYPYCDQGIDNSVLVYGYCAWLLAFLGWCFDFQLINCYIVLINLIFCFCIFSIADPNTCERFSITYDNR